MNILLFTASECINNTVNLHPGDKRHSHLCTVIKPTYGQRLNIGILHGALAQVKVSTHLCHTKPITLSIVSGSERLPPSPVPITVVLALPRPKVFKRVVHSLSELGVKQLHCIHSQKVEKSYWQSPLLKPERWTPWIHEGLCQAKDTMPITIDTHRWFKPFVEDTLPTIIGTQPAWLAHPYATRHINQLSPPCAPAVVIIGPEGGFTPYEVQLIEQQGVTTVTLGERIYRTETAIQQLLANFMGNIR